MLPIRPTHDGVLIDIVDRDITRKELKGGKVLHLIADDSFSERVHNSKEHTHPGIRPRWARVLAVGPDVHEDDLQLGDLVLCDTLKWGRKFPLGRDGQEIVYLWRIGVKDILGVESDSQVNEFVKDWQDKVSRLSLTIGHL